MKGVMAHHQNGTIWRRAEGVVEPPVVAKHSSGRLSLLDFAPKSSSGFSLGMEGGQART